MSHLKARDTADRTREQILSVRVIDCSSKSLTALVQQQKDQIKNIDKEIKATETRIKAIDQEIENTLFEAGLMDAYEYGVLGQVAPTTVEHHNILRYIRDAEGEKSSLEQGLEQLLKRKEQAQNQLNSTVKFADSVTKAGEACPEQPRTASVSMTATPLDQKPAQVETPGAPLSPEQVKAAQEKGREWASADYDAGWSSDSLPFRYSIQYRFDWFQKNHPLSEQERKPFADGYWSAYKELNDRAPAQAVSSPAAGTIGADPLRHLRVVADAWIKSGNAHLQSQGKSLSAQLEQIEKSRQATGASQSGGTQPISSGAWRSYKVEGKISGLPSSIKPRGFFTTWGNPSLFWGSGDGSAPHEFKIDGNGSFNIDDIWSPGDFLKGPSAGSAKPDGNRKFNVDDIWSPGDFLRGPPAGSVQDRIEIQLDDERWKAPLISPLRMSLRNLGQGDSTISGWKSEDAAVRATRTAPGRTFVAPDSFKKLDIKAFSLQGLTPGCKSFINGLGVTYSEPNLRRGVAPAPSLDPAHWPNAKPEPPVFSLSGQP
jgi:hypothetical protein